MVLGLMGNLGKQNFKEILPSLIQELRARGAKFVLDEEAAEGLGLSADEKLSAEKIPDAVNLILSFGGDGTLLRSASTVGNRQVPILGVNLGPGLGYLTELPVNALTQSLDTILSEKYRVEDRMMLVAYSGDTENNSVLALNDIVLGNEHVSRTLRVEVSIDGKSATTYRCDGLIIATPTGSTAYSLSSGGPIVEPKLKVVIVTPISPHTLTMRPVVVSDERIIKIKAGGDAILAADGEPRIKVSSGEYVTVKRAPFVTKLASVKGTEFYQVLRQKLQWGSTKTLTNN